MANLVHGLLALAWLLPGPGAQERLPIEVFTTADGLGSNVVHQIVRDSRGYLWFCTREGLSRFDGHEFVTFGVEHGLTSPVVYEFLETRRGELWLGTRGGLVRFDPLGEPTARPDTVTGRRPMFTTYTTGEPGPANSVSALLEGRDGVLWVGTWRGLYRLEAQPGGAARLAPVEIGLPAIPEHRVIGDLAEGPSGDLWIGSASGLYRLAPGGDLGSLSLPQVSGTVTSLLLDRDGNLWVGTSDRGLSRARLDLATGRLVDVRGFTIEGLADAWMLDIHESSDGGLWIGTTRGLVQVLPGPDGDARFRGYGLEQGLPYWEVWGIEEGADGSLWLATTGGGAGRIGSLGFSIFDAASFGARWAQALLTTAEGDVLVVGARDSSWSLYDFTGQGLREITALPARASWGWNQTVLVDRAGDWWVGSGTGVYRYSGLSSPDQISRATPTAVYTREDGLASDVVLRLFTDSRGDVWIGTARETNGLSRWRRATGSLDHYGTDVLPPLESHYVSALAEDASGAVWIGFSGDGGLARWRDGGFTRFAGDVGLPPGAIWDLLVDARGRLWAASYHGGLIRCDDPEAESPTFTRHTTAEGLSSNSVTALVEDPRGLVYVATGRGIDRLDPATGRVAHVTRGAGFPAGEISAAAADRQGSVWFRSAMGLVRMKPRDLPASRPPPTFITGARVAGEEVPVSARGQIALVELTLPANRGDVEIDFVAPGWGPGGTMRYQVRLDGADSDWGEPSGSRSIRYASLSPGSYRFGVRAVNAEGLTGEAAGFAFTVLPPIWMRGWFLALAGIVLASVAVSLYRRRVSHLLELADLRTRIATDLHDDIGANLTRIAVTSEVARRLAAGDAVQTDRRLASIAELARESTTSLAEIVWAVRPEGDRLEDLTRKLREYAEDLVLSENLDLEFVAPGPEESHRIDIAARREVFLVGKEAIRNAVRHAGCARISVSLRADGASLVLEVRDDGRGFDPAAAAVGNGLVSMRRRAARAGARLTVESRHGEGTTVRLVRPMDRLPGRRRTPGEPDLPEGAGDRASQRR